MTSRETPPTTKPAPEPSVPGAPAKPGEPGKPWVPGDQLTDVTPQRGARAPKTEKGAVFFTATLNIENTRKYGFDSSAGTRVTAKLVSVPAPSAFMAAVLGVDLPPKEEPKEEPNEEPKEEPMEEPKEEPKEEPTEEPKEEPREEPEPEEPAEELPEEPAEPPEENPEGPPAEPAG